LKHDSIYYGIVKEKNLQGQSTNLYTEKLKSALAECNISLSSTNWYGYEYININNDEDCKEVAALMVELYNKANNALK
jgi:hypothetical protein